jgi:hypothetical protein
MAENLQIPCYFPCQQGIRGCRAGLRESLDANFANASDQNQQFTPARTMLSVMRGCEQPRIVSTVHVRPLLHGKDIYRTTRRHVGILSRKQQVQPPLHASGVHAPPRLDRNVLFAVH